jgi:hypothetical protein
VVEEPGQIHVPNLNQKMRVQKTECKYCIKKISHLPTNDGRCGYNLTSRDLYNFFNLY